MRRFPISPLLTVAALACSPGEAPAPTTVVSDSAGVRIVLNRPDSLPVWHVEEMPALSIGSVSGEDGQDLNFPWSSVQLPGERIAVANAGSNELRIYDSTGALVRTSGGPGQGPGEFRLIALLDLVAGDTLIAADASLPRLNVFSAGGEFLRTVPLDDLRGRMPRFRGMVAGDTALYRVPFYGRSGGRSSAVRDTFLFALRPFHGEDWHEIGRFLADEKFNQILNGGQSVAGWPLPFGRSVYTAVGGGHFWIGISDNFDIHRYDARGELTAMVRMEHELQQVTGDLRERFFEHHLEQAADEADAETRRAAHEEFEFPETLPAYSALHLDTSGNLWVQEYTLPWDEGPSRWLVFDPDGVAVARARIPVGLDIQEIGDDFVRGRWRDDLGVDYIRSHRIVR